MELKEACELSYKVWIWLFLNPGKSKQDSPYWHKIRNMYYDCPLCEFYSPKNNRACRNCYGNDFYGCFGKAYDNWLDGISKKSAAAHIAFTIRKFMRLQGWEVI